MTHPRRARYGAVAALLLMAGIANVPCASAQNLRDGNACRLVAFIPFSDSREGLEGDQANPNDFAYSAWPDQETLAKASFSLLASAEMAKRHFNDRDTTIVKELADLQSCPIQLDGDYFDSAYSRTRVVDQILKIQNEAVAAGKAPAANICGIIGPTDAEAHEGLSVLTENLRVPQVAYSTIDHGLGDSDAFPYFARVIPEGFDFADTLTIAITRGDIWKREYVAIIYEDNYGEQFEDPLEDAEEDFDFASITEGYDEGSDESMREILGVIKEDGYRTIIIAANRYGILDDIARIAEEMEMLGEEYFWLITGDAFPPAIRDKVKIEVDSPLDKLLNGAALFTNYDPFHYRPDNDPFLAAWKAQDASLIPALNAKVPTDSNGDLYFEAGDDYFSQEIPTEWSSYIYDAVMASAIAACKAYEQASSATDDTSSTPKNLHHQSILQSEFQGASGPLKFARDGEETLTSRDATDVSFGLHNLRPLQADSDGMRRYESVLTHLYTTPVDADDGGRWTLEDGQEFLFFGQTNVEPMPLRTVSDFHYLSKPVQTAGIILASVALFVCLTTVLWVAVNSNEREVKASQPFFLYLVCFGSSLVAVSLFCLSFDEEKGWSQDQLDKACSAFPWLFMLGYLITYCALFSKLWRLSRVLQMRRQVVSVSNSLVPFCFVIVSTLIVLTTWQFNDPLRWKREIIREQPLETFGECVVDNNILAYLVPLGFLIFLVIVTTAVMAWKLKHVQSNLAESKWIFVGILTQLQTWAIGIPIVIITDDISKDAGYVMYAALTFMFSITMVIFVIWPKIYAWARERYFGGAMQNQQQQVPRINLTKPSTRVSGIDASAATTFMRSHEGLYSSAVNESTLDAYENEVMALRQQQQQQQRRHNQVDKPISKSEEMSQSLDSETIP